MSGATTVLHEKSPAATGSPTYGSCFSLCVPCYGYLIQENGT